MKHFRLTEEQLQAIQARAQARGAVRTVITSDPGESQPRKYRNRPTKVGGINFASQKEADRYADLCLMQKAGEIAELERQVRFVLRVNGQEICCYIADFTYRNGKLVVEDSKGVKTRDYIIKKKLMLALHGIEILET